MSQITGITKKAQYLRSQVVAQQSQSKSAVLKSSIVELLISRLSRLAEIKLQAFYFLRQFLFFSQKTSTYFSY